MRQILALVIALLAVSAGAVAYAAIPGTGGVIHACYDKSGALRVIDTATSNCTAKETALSWNQQGPPGPQGVPGPQGATGATGPAGPTPITYMTVATGVGFASVGCYQGDMASGGGAYVTSSPTGNTALRATAPNSPTSWRALSEDSGAQIDVWAICQHYGQ